jgi:Polyketide cyclase / dehydrase and lipid transport
MMRIEERCTFPISAEEAFDYITDLDNWPHYWPGFVRFEDREHSQWGVPGGAVTPVIRLMGRDVPLHITLQEFERGRIVRYMSQQPGLRTHTMSAASAPSQAGARIARWSARRRAGSGWESTIVSS